MFTPKSISDFSFKKKKSKEKYNQNKPQNSAFLVISDSSQCIEKQPSQQLELNVSDEKQVPIQLEQNEANQQLTKQKPIRQRTYEQRLNLTPKQSKPSKKIKLDNENQQQVQIIRFGAIKNEIAQILDQQDKQKLKKAKHRKAYPWISKSTKQIEDACLRFHNQTVEFYQYIKPSKRQHETRLQIFNMVKQMITQKYPQAEVQYFGSFATKLYLPDGDIDITVLIDDINDYEQRKVYDAIHKAIRKSQGTVFCDIQYIRNSKVPLIKFLHIDTQVPFDISVNKKDGLVQVQHVQRMKKLYPEFQPLVFIFKTILKVRNMSQTYTGGIGSFLLSCMILHYLRYVHKKQYYYTMGEFIMKFMEFYSITGDWERKSIYVADSSQVGRAREPGTLSFFSPQDDSHDIGKSAYKIRDVFNVFKNRFRVITGKNFKQGESILKQLINPSGQQFRYYKYEKAMNKQVQ